MPPILQSDEVLVNRKSTSPTVNPFSTISASFGFCHVFSVTSSLCSRIQSRAPRCIGLLYFLCPLRSMTISQSFSIFMTVSILRNTSPISCRMSSNLGLSDFFFFSWFDWGHEFEQEKHKNEVPFLSHHMRLHMTFTRRLWWCWPSSLGKGGICQVSQLCIAIFTFPNSILWKQVTKSSLLSRGRGGDRPLEVEISADIKQNAFVRKIYKLIKKT